MGYSNQLILLMTSSDSANETVILIIAGASLFLLVEKGRRRRGKVLVKMSQVFVQMTENGSSARETVQSCHYSMNVKVKLFKFIYPYDIYPFHFVM